MIVKTNKGKPMLLSKCTVFDRKMFRFIKEQEASTLLSTFGLKAPLSKIPVFGDNLFYRYKMNEIVNKFLLAGEKFMPEVHIIIWNYSQNI